MRIGLIGYGKMGKAIEEIALERGHSVVVKATSKTKDWDKNLSEVDVAIEFTSPSSAVDNISRLLQHNIPVVTGTTGWYDQYSEIEARVHETEGSFLAATNFSIGVNLFFAINQFVAQLMNAHTDYDVSLEEVHHTQKADAPSGTAITLGEQIIAHTDRKHDWKCIENTTIDFEKKPENLLIEAVRKEGVPGTHTVRYTSDIDTIELTHTAHNRKGFALGAVLAAEFIKNKKGIFTMRDVLNLK